RCGVCCSDRSRTTPDRRRGCVFRRPSPSVEAMTVSTGEGTMQTSTADQIRATVREAYGAVATRQQQGGCCGGSEPTSCCGPTGTSSTRLGYSEADVTAVPDGADLGLGCGNPQ